MSRLEKDLGCPCHTGGSSFLCPGLFVPRSPGGDWQEQRVALLPGRAWPWLCLGFAVAEPHPSAWGEGHIIPEGWTGRTRFVSRGREAPALLQELIREGSWDSACLGALHILLSFRRHSHATSAVWTGMGPCPCPAAHAESISRPSLDLSFSPPRFPFIPVKPQQNQGSRSGFTPCVFWKCRPLGQCDL